MEPCHQNDQIMGEEFRENFRTDRSAITPLNDGESGRGTVLPKSVTMNRRTSAAKGKELFDEDVALAIGAYESVFLANIVASYLFEETEECFENCIFRGIYRDN
eukprot:2923500-Ditylum_brightwellii.AAC.2